MEEERGKSTPMHATIAHTKEHSRNVCIKKKRNKDKLLGLANLSGSIKSWKDVHRAMPSM